MSVLSRQHAGISTSASADVGPVDVGFDVGGDVGLDSGQPAFWVGVILLVALMVFGGLHFGFKGAVQP